MHRRSSGSVFLLALVLAAVLFGIFVVGIWLFKYNALQLKQNAFAEATALGCAQELSRIVVEDPHFGFVSLTEQNGGTRTVSHSGESLPVRGINTILANIRQTRLLAMELGNAPLMDLTEHEFSQAQSTLNLLKKALAEAAQAKSGPRSLASDVNGQPVDLYKKARQVYSQCSGQSDLSGIDFEIKLGQLADGGPTTTAAPLPERLGAIKQSQLFGSDYMSCVKIPCQDLNFVFASLSSQATLGNIDSFRELDATQFGSVLRLSVTRTSDSLRAAACAVPPSYRVSPSYATIVLDLPVGMDEQDAVTFADFLRKDFSGGNPNYCTPENGDFPIDENCRLSAASGADNFGYTVGELIYDWLLSSNANSPDTLKSIVEIFNTPLASRAERQLFSSFCLALYFDKDAKLHRHLFCRNPFYKGFISEAQDSGQSTVSFSTGEASVSFINDVTKIGTTNSGKHGGQLIDISTIDGPSVLATNLEDEEAYERRLLRNTVLPSSEPLPYTLRFAGQLQVLSGPALAASTDR